MHFPVCPSQKVIYWYDRMQAPKKKDDVIKRIHIDAEGESGEDPSEAFAREKDKVYVRYGHKNPFPVVLHIYMHDSSLPSTVARNKNRSNALLGLG
jgi:hypothetical protein